MADRVSRRELLGIGGAVAGATALQSCTGTERAQKPSAERTGPERTGSLRGERPAVSAIAGPSINVDPHFPYYRDRSAQSIADEIQLAGYDVVHLVVVNEHRVDGALIRALKARGIAVWALVFGNGTYSTDDLPPTWPRWQMELLTLAPALGYTFFSHFSREYRQWKKATAATLVRDHPVDGFEIMEPFFPEWDGLDSGVYGDVGPLAVRAFERTHNMAAPQFADPSSQLYFAAPRNRERYRRWIDLRVDAVNSLVDDIVNGPDGVRAARSDILVATWSAAIDAGPNAIRRLREDQGLDAAAMVTTVRPDLHFFQTHWPDWTRTDLPPNYARSYTPFIGHLRRAAPDLPIGIQADIGSKRPIIRQRPWLDAFSDTMPDLGCATWTAYEYHLGGYMYTEPPVPLAARRLDDRRVRISFSKRVDDTSTDAPDTFTIRSATRPRSVGAVGDGNLVTVTWDGSVETGAEIEVRNVKDTPQYWFLGAERRANVVPPDTRIRVT